MEIEEGEDITPEEFQVMKFETVETKNDLSVKDFVEEKQITINSF